jgi:glycosyltransferase involved in cell wall biosynthesis
MPRVSIGLPVFNGENYLEEAIRSLVGQTFKDFELIISDNASTDRTADICRKYAAADRRISYTRQETNIGGGQNANFTISRATGEFFKLASHDDVCAPAFLELCIAALDADPEAVIAFPQSVDIDAEGHRLERRHISPIPRSERASSPDRRRRFRNLIRTDYGNEEIFGVIRMDILRRTNLFGNYTDCDRTLLALLGLHGKIVEVPEELFYHRIHPHSSSYAVLPGVAPGHLGRAHRLWQDITYWYKPGWTGREVYPTTWQLRDYMAMIGRFPMPLADRIACGMALVPWLARKWPFLGIEFRARIAARRRRRGAGVGEPGRKTGAPPRAGGHSVSWTEARAQ